MNLSRTPLNNTGTLEHYNTTGLSQIADKNVAKQGSIKSPVKIEKFNIAL